MQCAFYNEMGMVMGIEMGTHPMAINPLCMIYYQQNNIKYCTG